MVLSSASSWLCSRNSMPSTPKAVSPARRRGGPAPAAAAACGAGRQRGRRSTRLTSLYSWSCAGWGLSGLLVACATDCSRGASTATALVIWCTHAQRPYLSTLSAEGGARDSLADNASCSCSDAAVTQTLQEGMRAQRPVRDTLLTASGRDELALLADWSLQASTAAQAAGRTSAQGCVPTTSAWLGVLPPRVSAAHTPPLPAPAAVAPLPPGAPGAAAASAWEHCASSQCMHSALCRQRTCCKAGQTKKGCSAKSRIEPVISSELCEMCAAP